MLCINGITSRIYQEGGKNKIKAPQKQQQTILLGKLFDRKLLDLHNIMYITNVNMYLYTHVKDVCTLFDVTKKK